MENSKVARVMLPGIFRILALRESFSSLVPIPLSSLMFELMCYDVLIHSLRLLTSLCR